MPFEIKTQNMFIHSHLGRNLLLLTNFCTVSSTTGYVYFITLILLVVITTITIIKPYSRPRRYPHSHRKTPKNPCDLNVWERWPWNSTEFQRLSRYMVLRAVATGGYIGIYTPQISLPYIF